MIYYLLQQIDSVSNSALTIMQRSIMSMSLAFFACLIVFPKSIAFLRNWHPTGQPLNNYLEDMHDSKKATPTMGGITIIGVVLTSVLLTADLSNSYIRIITLVLTIFGGLGFIDDYLKITRRNNQGIIARVKLYGQLLASIITVLLIQSCFPAQQATSLYIPLFGNVDLSFCYTIFAVFVMIAASNAVNLTDGLDGLAAGPVVTTILSLSLISYLVSDATLANHLSLPYIPGAAELSVAGAIIAGACLGFLWFNTKPAQIFMGDTGSLALGAVIGAMALSIKHELILIISGGVFVVEVLSVIAQVLYFKYTGGRRILLMAPLHHHFEKAGLAETKIVVRFWIVSLICAILAISITCAKI